jgi:hypothetical protein
VLEVLPDPISSSGSDLIVEGEFADPAGRAQEEGDT